jgi:DnaK suppressor protein
MSNSIGLAANKMQNVLPHPEGGLVRKHKGSRHEQAQRLKKALLQARSVILEELSSTGSALADRLPEVEADFIDQSASDLERTLCLLLRERGRDKLNAIDDALERIQEGSYGVCEDCGERIPVGRLEAMPFATTCRDCKTQREKRGKLFSSSDEPGFHYD